MKTLLRTLPLIAAACWTMHAHAAIVTTSGVCEAHCEGLGLPIGGTVSATFDIDYTGGANVWLGRDAINSFVVQFGNITFDSSDAASWDFRMLTGENDTVAGLQFLASFGTSFDDRGDTVDLRESVWWSSHNGACSDGVSGMPCDFAVTAAFGAYDGQWGAATSSITLDTQGVPEPSSLALAAVGLLGLSGVSGVWRRNARVVG